MESERERGSIKKPYGLAQGSGELGAKDRKEIELDACPRNEDPCGNSGLVLKAPIFRLPKGPMH